MAELVHVIKIDASAAIEVIEKYSAYVAQIIKQRDELLSALKQSRRELHACQAAIHLAGGFDPAYVLDAKASLKVSDAIIAKATGETK